MRSIVVACVIVALLAACGAVDARLHGKDPHQHKTALGGGAPTPGAPVMVGGLTKTRDATPKVKALIEKMLPEILKVVPTEYANAVKVEAVSFATQLVAGTNFFVKVRFEPTAGAEPLYAHVRIWKALNGALELTAVQHGKSQDEVRYTFAPARFVFAHSAGSLPALR